MAEPAIECDGIWKKFSRGERSNSLRDAIPALAARLFRRPAGELDARQFWALADVSFEVQRGQALGIIGPNGAGKSTLLKILSRIMAPDRGRVHIRGRLTALIEVGAGFHADLTGRENIFLNGAVLGMTRKEIRRTIGRIVEFAGVGEFIDTPVKRYSSGMQARLGFSVAAHMDPDILLVDEVLAVGDAEFQQRCLEKMHYFANSGRSIVFISHNLQAISELCPQALLLLSGRRAHLGSTSAAIQEYLRSMRDRETRRQDGAVRVDHVRLVNAAGRNSTHFASGEPARLSFDVVLDRPPSEFLLTFGLKRATDGFIVSDYNLSLPLDDDQRGPVTIDIDFVTSLLTGTYSVVLLLLDRVTYEKRVNLDFVKVFDVVEPTAHGGVSHVSPQISRRQVLAAVSG